VGPRAVLAVIGIGALAVIALWWHSTPDVRGLGGWLTGAGEVLGLLAGYGVVVLVALMARLPPLERGIGTDQLARWHAMGGRYIADHQNRAARLLMNDAPTANWWLKASAMAR